ncbi:chemotaxis protein CheW [Desulfonema magnum]|uniref:Chemotaxis protein n=1 Tax=Desulfonema magnum TaxID=45655 RepID=A0A975BLU6_9BACT|nr:chemotaxis protein CheW [Desulfonema magnum]QTA87369.1 Chemotaxis protein [Desulfonema magnum]
MLILLFYIGNIMYTIKCEKIREIAPMVVLKDIPHTPDFFAGYFNYRGIIVPVIDLCQLVQGRACEMRLSTRIILVDYKGKNDTSHPLGLIAERVTETVRKPEDAFVLPDIRSEQAPYLGGIVMEKKKMIQYIDLDLLPNCINFLPGGD